MTEKTLSQITSNVNSSGVQFLEKEGQILFSSEEIGHQLGYKDPRKSVNVLFDRNRKELSNYVRDITVMSRDGKPREVRHFTEEGVYILSMLAETPLARDFRIRVARLLRELRERRTELAHEAGYQQGLDAAYALPAAEATRKAAYLDGLREGERLQKRRDGLGTLEKALVYLGKGLHLADAAKLVNVPASTLRERVQRLRRNMAGVRA